jgi:hypothetical protein
MICLPPTKVFKIALFSLLFTTAINSSGSCLLGVQEEQTDSQQTDEEPENLLLRLNSSELSDRLDIPTPEPAFQISPDIQQLKRIGRSLLEDPQAITQYRVGWTQATQITKDRDNAIFVFQDAREAAMAIEQAGLVVPARFSKVDVRKVDMVGYGSNEDERFQTRKRLNARTPFYELSYVDPKSNDRRFHSVFAFVDGEWAFCYKPWASVADPETKDQDLGFFYVKMLVDQRYQDAYDFSSPVLREVMDFEKFKTHVARFGLNEVTSITWKSKARERRNSEWVFIREGFVEFFDETTANISLEFTSDEHGPRPFRITIEHLMGAKDSYAFTPDETKCKEIAHANLLKLIAAIQAGDFEDFHKNTCSYELRTAHPVATFEEAFKAFATEDWKFVENAEVTLGTRPLYSSEYDGTVLLEGALRNNKAGRVMAFTMNTNEYSSDKWELNAIHLYPVRDFDADQVPEPDQDKLLDLAIETSKLFVQCMKSNDFQKLHARLLPEVQETASPGESKKRFEAMVGLFQPEGLFHNPADFSYKFRTNPYMEGDFWKASIVVSEPGGEWIQADLEFIFQTSEWKLNKFAFKY